MAMQQRCISIFTFVFWLGVLFALMLLFSIVGGPSVMSDRNRCCTCLTVWTLLDFGDPSGDPSGIMLKLRKSRRHFGAVSAWPRLIRTVPARRPSLVPASVGGQRQDDKETHEAALDRLYKAAV